MKNTLKIFILISSILTAQNRPSIHQEQLELANQSSPPPADLITVQNGIDVLLDQHSQRLAGKNIALVTNHSGVTKAGIPNYRVLMELADVNLKVIFSPEHGLFGEAAAGEKIKYGDDLKELPEVISLYGKIRKPTATMLESVDLILYDIQDIGARFYTYISTMGLVMEAAGEVGIPIWILDRPNPIRGDFIEGPLLEMKHQSFVGYYPIPIRYGLTAGELAQLIIDQQWINSSPELEIISVTGWTKAIWFDETDLPWVAPSPNIPDLETAIVYPGMCLLEGTNISEGRGTYRPFKQIGAPWIDAHDLAAVMNNLNLPGVVFKPVSYTPVSIKGMSGNPKYKDQICNGIELIIADRNFFNSVETGVQLLVQVNKMYPAEFQLKEKWLIKLWGNDLLVKGLNKGYSADKIFREFAKSQNSYSLVADQNRIYPD
ncbi:MAG: DUF1343 domain-containing protein [Candidatus Marinimicrobia bacterium]|nr:DUF1343 domain-containing protein [Candidatus Neomarinimicrobiota bacterium]